MAITFTVTPVKTYSIGDRYELIADVACSAGTPSAGGDDLTGAALGFDLELNLVTATNATKADGTGGVITAVIPGTNKATIQFYVQGTAGAGNALVKTTIADMSPYGFRVRAVGKGSVRA